MLNRLNYVCLVVADLKKSITFYKKLGFKVKTNNINEYVEFDNKGSILALLTDEVIKKTNLAGKGKLASRPKAPKTMIFGLEPVKNVDEIYNNLRKKGVKFLTLPENMYWGQRVAYFSDPDGNIWEISTWTKKENE